MGSVGQNSIFSVKFKRHECSNRVANILTADHPPHPGDGVSRPKYNFSEHGHVAYHIKENHRCSNMLENTLPTDPPLRLGVGDQIPLFKNMVMLHIKLKRITNAATSKYLPADSPPPSPLRTWSGGQNTTLSEHGHVAYQIKENLECSIMVANILFYIHCLFHLVDLRMFSLSFFMLLHNGPLLAII